MVRLRLTGEPDAFEDLAAGPRRPKPLRLSTKGKKVVCGAPWCSISPFSVDLTLGQPVRSERANACSNASAIPLT